MFTTCPYLHSRPYSLRKYSTGFAFATFILFSTTAISNKLKIKTMHKSIHPGDRDA